eukprot:CAMPEP_0185529158 /NCGR_PEP_ID=MMETSP1366-20130426/100645_1 /TAXON_ID=38817 /ORGANISM="Gephyrocapsa oceanica, Strain RCC1303" /LENGTH=57 /DNA_ID=CAMNT_0028140759 /DNA_START=95 /DNA_END=265 /DNA_ORIENTATION=+
MRMRSETRTLSADPPSDRADPPVPLPLAARLTCPSHVAGDVVGKPPLKRAHLGAKLP